MAGRDIDQPSELHEGVLGVVHLKSEDYDAFKRRDLYAWMMMRDGNYKYIRHFKDGVLEEVYDLENDPEELNNLAVHPEYREMLAKLRQKAEEEFRKKDGAFIDYLPEANSTR